ncbi:MAG: heterodisulfide reductase-related iron-sulfur binding cluster [bacterium]
MLAAAGVGPVRAPGWWGRTSGVRFARGGAPRRPATLTTLRAGVAGAQRLICLDAGDAVALRAAWHGGPAIEHLVEAVAGRLPPLAPRPTGDVLYLDACRLGRGLGQYDAPREVLARAIDGRVDEATMTRREAGCCGAGAAYAAVHPAGAAAVAREAAADRPALPVVIADGPCAAHLRAALAPRPVWHWAEVVAAALPEGKP